MSEYVTNGEDIPEDEHFGRHVEVTWVDSGLAVHPGWTNRHALPPNVSTVKSVGFWVGENDNVVALAGSVAEGSESILNCQLIYKPCIVTKEFLS